MEAPPGAARRACGLGSAPCGWTRGSAHRRLIPRRRRSSEIQTTVKSAWRSLRTGKQDISSDSPFFAVQRLGEKRWWPVGVKVEQRPKKPPPKEPEWGWFDWGAYTEKWETPWGGEVLALGMFGWAASSIIVGALFIPQAIRWLGYSSFGNMSQQQIATLLLSTQALETAVGVGIIYLVVRPWMPFSTTLFNYSIEGPLKKPKGWLAWGGFGICLSLAVNVALAQLLAVAGFPEGTGKGTVDIVLDMVSMDWGSYLSLMAVVGVLAPVLEETVFRGFLLTTLTKWMPTPVAVVVSSTMFGFAHFSPKDLPFLIAVGMVWGFMYVRSKNLLTPMVMHSFWNSTVLTALYVLMSAGYDIKQLV